MTYSSTGYVAQRGIAWVSSLRTSIATGIGAAINWTAGSLMAQLTTSLGDELGDADARLQSIVDQTDPETAEGVALTTLARIAGVERQEATHSRYILLASGPTQTVAAGTLLRGGGSDGEALWSVVTATAINPFISTQVTVDAVEAGAVEFSEAGTTTLSAVSPVPGATFTYDPSQGYNYTVGNPTELDSELRVRRRAAFALPRTTSQPGLRAALLALSWVEAVDLDTPAAGTVGVTVAPAPVGSDQIAELATTIFAGVAYGTTYSGANTATVTAPDGGSASVAWDVGSTQDVVVAISGLSIASGYSTSDVQAAIIEAMRGLFAELTTGETLRFIHAIAEVGSVDGVIGATLTLDGGSADVSPASAADILTLDSDTVVFS